MCVALFSNVTRFLIANMMAQLIDGGSGGSTWTGCWLLVAGCCWYSIFQCQKPPLAFPCSY